MYGEDRITQAWVREVLDYSSDTGEFIWKVGSGARARKGAIAGTVNVDGYRLIGLKKRQYLAHRVVWVYVYGKWPAAQLDHINHKRGDNRLCNLREVTNLENCHNMSSSPSVGVRYHQQRKRWVAKITANGKDRWLGSFPTVEEAIAARKQAESEYHPSKPLLVSLDRVVETM